MPLSDNLMTANRDMTGYIHEEYIKSLSDFGSPVALAHCNGWILRRKIPGTNLYDAMGSYPLFCCNDWKKLHLDLEKVGDDLISVTIVTDPIGNYNEDILIRCFADLVKPFKEHFLIDLKVPLENHVDKNHLRNVRRSLLEVDVEKCEHHNKGLSDWISLYAKLIKRHNITGIPAFSEKSFEKQFYVPGLHIFRASYRGETIGMLLWYVQGEVGYYHLGAYSEQGYKLRASFPLFWFAIDWFKKKGLPWLNLGAGAGATNDGSDGLTRFKKGWATTTRINYLCGRIFNMNKYLELSQSKNRSCINYFPAYRAGEFK